MLRLAGVAASLLLVAAAIPDWRQLDNGVAMTAEPYLDQPYCVVMPATGRVLCTITVNTNAGEGSGGEHVASLFSDDNGASWSQLLSLEPGVAVDNAYSNTLLTSFGRVYAVYNLNLNNVTTLDGKHISRTDTLGLLAAKYTDDAGGSWSKQRTILPMPATAIDRNNSFYRQHVKMFWTVDQMKFASLDTYPHNTTAPPPFFAFTKIQRYSYLPPEQVFMYTSSNVMTETNASAVEWTMLPDGDTGLPAPGPAWSTILEEPHVIPMVNATTGDATGMYVTARTNTGYLAATHTSDATGRSGWAPTTFAVQFEVAAQPSARATPSTRRVKNPRGPTTSRRLPNGMFLLLSYFNSHASYEHRNPYWLSVGVAANGTTVVWGQPEVALFDRVNQGGDRPGYPDIVVTADGGVAITETNKTVARWHPVDNHTLACMFAQLTVADVATGAVALTFKPTDAGTQFATPPLTPFNRDATSAGDGFTFDITAAFGDGAAVLLDTRAASAPSVAAAGVVVQMANASSLSVTLCDGATAVTLYAAASCVAPLATSGVHHLGVVADASAHVVTVTVNGVVCDGGEQAAAGWAWLPTTLGDVTGNGTLRLLPQFDGRLASGHLYTRALLHSELMGNFRAGVAALD